LETGELILRDKDYVVVPISAVNKGASNGVFQISAALNLDKSPYYLQNKSSFWKICTEMFFGQMSDLMEGVNFGLNPNAVGEISRETALNMLYDASSRQVRFESSSMVQEVSMYSLAGALIGNWKINQFEGAVPVGKVTPGVYVMHFSLPESNVGRKVMVTK